MYKVSYLDYHIAKCGSFQELLDTLEGHEMVSHSKYPPRRHDRAKAIRSIAAVLKGGRLQYCTRAHGFRAKVAELALTGNYGDPFPYEIVAAMSRI